MDFSMIRTDSCTQQRNQQINTEQTTSLLRPPHITKYTISQRIDRASTKNRKETRCNQDPFAIRKATGNIPDQKPDIGSMQDRLPTIHLRQRPDNQGSKSVARR